MQNRRTPLTAATSGALALLSVMAIALMPKEVRAEEQGAFGTLTVQFTGSLECASGDSICSLCVQAGGLSIEAQGIAETTLGPLFAKVLKCFNPNPTSQFPYGTYAGTLTLSTTPPVTPPSLISAPKDILTLTYSGQNTDAGDFYGFQPFVGQLKVESGAGKFRGAQGTISFKAQSGPSLVAAEFGATGASPFAMTGNAFYLLLGTINQGGNQ